MNYHQYGLLVLLVFSSAVCAVNPSQSLINIAYVKVKSENYAGVPGYLVAPDDEGVSGAMSAINDANITGKFLGYQFSLDTLEINRDLALSDDELSTLQQSTAIIVDVDSVLFNDLIAKLHSQNAGALLLNVRNHNNASRQALCDVSLLHIAPTYQMKADALGQWYRTKRIEDILVIWGATQQDNLFKAAFENTAKKFKLDIIESKAWQFSFDLRRSAFNEIPQFTRTRKDYEAIFVADYANQFGYSLPFNTANLVPVTGDAGMQATGWHLTHEQWGARQLQNRFVEQFGRAMTQYDYFAYTGVIAISTATQNIDDRTGVKLYENLLSQDTSIAAYKGRKLTFRQTTRQLRQPLLLAHESAIVTSAPLPGFLHQSNELDTLGSNVSGCKGN